MLSYIFGCEKVNQDVKKKLFLAVRKNCCNQIVKHFEETKGDNVDKYRDSYNNSLLHVAINYGRKEIMEHLLNLGASMDTLNELKTTPMDMLMRKNNRELLNSYISFKYREVYQVKAELERKNSMQQDNINELTKKLSSTSELLTKLEKINKELLKQIEDLRKEKNLLSSTLVENNKKINEKISMIKNLENISKKLTEENMALRGDNTSLKVENTALNQNNKRLREQGDELDKNNKKLRSTVESLTEAAKKKQ
ncbi:ankyrin repeat protein [Catovirus CTV1]|uniref:Ankyrin repeat protein n=1 Tax=Catovirus CTV1 TaxID=1977631 RepID=A0A1V0SAD2_9VIRU|nr:ankyrin repeat protein [Catovirus CTV1]